MLIHFSAFTLSGDGTTHRSLNYESAHINLQAPTSYSPNFAEDLKPKIRRAEVRLSANHKASTQAAGDLAYMDRAIDIFHRSSMRYVANSVKQPVNKHYVLMKLGGTHGDHAEDQKAKSRLLEDLKRVHTDIALGERELYAKPENERFDFFRTVEDAAVCSVGGEGSWIKLSPLDQQKIYETIQEDSLRMLATDAKLKMNKNELKVLTSFVYVGCQMHKDLNAVKGGYQVMKEQWKKKDVSPCLLANKDNAAVLNAAALDPTADTVNTERASNVSVGGAIKLVELAGALLNHKDDKKGHHDAFRDYAKLKLGLTFTFPDTSNTRFSSYLEAASELTARSKFYLNYIEHARNRKEKQTHSNIEVNFKNGMSDMPTITELVVLTLYYEAVSFPYITTVRGGGLEEQNALDMGPFHMEVVRHISKLISNPELILSPLSEPAHAILGAYTHWKRPDAMSAVYETLPRLPFLREMFVAFLNGALKTWERFSAEFSENGIINELTSHEKQMLWMPTTNDANEGALGEWRSFSRRFPTGSLGLFNAISTYRHNNTQDFIDNILCFEEDGAFLRREGREELDEKRDSKKRKAVAEEMVAEAEAKRLKSECSAERKRLRTEHLASLELITSAAELNRLTVTDLRDQLAKYRQFDEIAKATTYLRKRDELLRVVSAAAARYMQL